MKEKIKKLANDIGIKAIFHFTCATNLVSISKSGIYPRSRLNEVCRNPTVNDALRLDGRKDTISTSISFPNYSMFFKYRKENPHLDWALIGIKPDILWEKDCGFCVNNAAKANISCKSFNELATFESFSEMFNDSVPGDIHRSSQRLAKCDPTDHQAEVLVRGIIEPKYFLGVVFESVTAHEAYKHLFGEKNTILVDKGKKFFNTRHGFRWGH